MTVSDNDFLDLQDRFNALKLTVDTLLLNLLNPALITPGTLRFGGNIMQLDHKGIQVVTKAELDQPSLFFVPEFRTVPDSTTPYAVLRGYGHPVAGNEDVAKMEVASYGESTIYARAGTQTFSTANGIAFAYLIASTSGTLASMILGSASGVANVELQNAYFKLATTGAAPASPADGDFWYDSNKLYARINGATVALGAGGSSMPMPPIVGPHTTMPLMGFFQSGTAATLLASTTWQGANEAIYVPVIVTEDCTITKLWVYNGAAVSGNIDVGVYDSSFAKVVSSGSTAQAGTSQIQEFNVADTAITAGLHYIGVALDNTTGTTLTRALSFTVGTAAETGQALGLAVQSSAFALPNPMVPAAYTRSIMPLAGFATRVLVT